LIFLKNREGGCVICLSHSGTSPTKEYIGRTTIAREVPQIDVDYQRHTHTILPQPIVTGKTIMFPAAAMGKSGCVKKIVYNKEKDIRLAAYDLQKCYRRCSR